MTKITYAKGLIFSVLACMIAYSIYYLYWHTPVSRKAHLSATYAASDAAAASLLPHPSKDDHGTEAAGSDKDIADDFPTLIKKMQSARDYRVLYLQFLQRMGDGGGLYAFNILRRCAIVRNYPAPLSWTGNSNHQEQAHRLWEERCASFIESELSTDNMRVLLQDPRMKTDPLMALKNEWTSSSLEPEQRIALISRLLATHDPMLLENVGGTFFVNDKAAIRFDGEVYPQDYAHQTFMAAWMAAVCDASQVCGQKDDFYVVDVCATHHLCFDSRDAYSRRALQDTYGTDAVKLYADIHPRMVRAIQQADAQVFR